MAKRARPQGKDSKPTQKAPKNSPLLALNSPYPGCCKPYPDARFESQVMVELYDHHIGPNCKGFMEPRSVEDWNAEIDAERVREVPEAKR